MVARSTDVVSSVKFCHSPIVGIIIITAVFVMLHTYEHKGDEVGCFAFMSGSHRELVVAAIGNSGQALEFAVEPPNFSKVSQHDSNDRHKDRRGEQLI